MYRKGVVTFPINNKDEFLLVNLINFEERYFAIPGGGQESGETLEDTAYREIEEEVGIKKSSLKLINKSDTPLFFKFLEQKTFSDGKTYIGSERNFFAFNFTGNNNDIVLQESEIRSYVWSSFSNLKNYLLFENQLEEIASKIKEMLPDLVKE